MSAMPDIERSAYPNDLRGGYDFHKARAEAAEAEIKRLGTENSALRLWIDSEGRRCPSNSTIDALLMGDEAVA